MGTPVRIRRCHGLRGQSDSLFLSAMSGSSGWWWEVGWGWTETQISTVWYSPSILSGMYVTEL